jgi:glycosyltransferase involved in cell wall biosynthesis
MPKITALIHACNNAPDLVRTFGSLHACDELLVVDHGSDDETEKVAKEHGAKFRVAILEVDECAYTVDASNDWILWIMPSEVVSEGMTCTLLEWKRQEPDEHTVGFAFNISEHDGEAWRSLGSQMRLVNRKGVNWTGMLPPDASNMQKLDGDLLRFETDR